LSLNALLNACNQTTNRDPVVKYDEATVEHALDALREQSLVRRLKAAGQRVIKYRHVADETLGLDPGEFAVLGLLLLRGEQTPGELKARSVRWADLTASGVEQVLQRLESRELVAQLPRRPGQKESRWAQLLCAAGDEPVADAPSTAVPSPQPQPPSVRTLDVRNPATGAVLRTIEVDDERAIAAKLERARRAQRAWAARSYAERTAVLERVRDQLAEELART
jgi:uncharacterized protein YceH (UPF0502 family)